MQDGSHGKQKGRAVYLYNWLFLDFSNLGKHYSNLHQSLLLFFFFFFLWIGDIAPTSINVYYQDQFLIMFQWMVGVEERKALIKVQKYATKEIGFRDMVRSYDVRMMSEFLRY